MLWRRRLSDSEVSARMFCGRTCESFYIWVALQARYTAALSSVANVLMCAQSLHLPADYRYSYGGGTGLCGHDRCGCQGYEPHSDFGDHADVESRLHHLEHLLLAWPPAMPSCTPALPIRLLCADFLQAAGNGPAVAVSGPCGLPLRWGGCRVSVCGLYPLPVGAGGFVRQWAVAGPIGACICASTNGAYLRGGLWCVWGCRRGVWPGRLST